MRLNINLATQPYEDARRFILKWSSILGALLVLAIILSALVVRRWQDYRRLSHSIAVERNVIQDLNAKQAEDLTILNRPNNREMRQRSDFLNQLIRRKEISWTRIFSTLEQTMPAHLRVLSMKPKIKENRIIISLELGGDSRDRAAELVRRMAKSSVFRNAQIVNERESEPSLGSQQDPMQFQITAEYVPNESAGENVATTANGTTGGGK
jgi:hypothetical protein